MKKLLIMVILLSLIALPAHAAQRGLQQNVFASWYSATTTTTAITFPYRSRDLVIINADAAGGIICVNLKGTTITDECVSEGEPNRPSIIQLASNESIHLQDFGTTEIAFKAATTASPVTIINSY